MRTALFIILFGVATLFAGSNSQGMIEFSNVLNGLVVNFSGGNGDYSGTIYLTDFGSNVIYYTDDKGFSFDATKSDKVTFYSDNKGVNGEFQTLGKSEVTFTTKDGTHISFMREGKNVLFISDQIGNGIYSKIGGSYFYEGAGKNTDYVLLFGIVVLFELIEIE